MTENTQQWGEILKTALTDNGKLSEAYSAFWNYSLGNQMAAMSQCASRGIQVGPIASFKAWGDKGRKIRKGEKAIELCMPITMKATKETAEGSEEYSFSRFVWRRNWFALCQTEGDEYIADIKIPQWDKAKSLETLKITEGSFDIPDGNCQGYASGRMIAVNPLAVLPHKTRFHELAHVVLGHTAESTMHDTDRTPKDIRELEAESVAYLLCSLLNLPGIIESRGYIQSWFKGAAIPEKSAQRIFSAADKILKSGA